MFNYYKFNENNSGKPQFIDASLPAPDNAYHASVYQFYSTEITGSTLRFADFWLDIDDKQNILKAVDDARATLSHLAGLGVDLSTVSIFASGSKGFHIRVPAKCLGANSRYNLPLVYKKVAESIIADTGVKSIDDNLYKMGLGQSLRIANKQRANGFYKVPITLQELHTIVSESDYFDLCSNPRPEIEVTPPTFVKELGQMFNSALKAVADDNKFTEVTLTSADIEILNGAIPNCVTQIINHENTNPDDNKSGFNAAKQSLARYLRNSGLDAVKQNAIIKQFAENYPSSTYPTPELRENELRSILKLKGDFSCSYMKAVLDKNPCSGCALLSKCKEKTTLQNLINKISTSETHIKKLIKELKTATGREHTGLGRTLCKSLAKGTPTKRSVETAIEIAVNAGVAEIEAKTVIQGAIDDCMAKVRAANKLTNFEGIKRVNVGELVERRDYDAIAEFIFKNHIEQTFEANYRKIRDGVACDITPVTILFNLPMAAGKTTVAAKIHKLIKAKQYELNKEWFEVRALPASVKRLGCSTVVAHRVSLIKGLSNAFDVADYQLLDDKYSFTGSYATCVDSLHQFKNHNPLLILDEIKQTVEHLVISETVGTKGKAGRIDIFNNFKKVMESATFIIAMDADLNDTTVDFIRKHGEGREIILIEAVEKPHKAKHVILSGGHDEARRKTLELLESGKRGTLAATSEKQALMTAKFLRGKGFRVLVLTGENKGGVNQKAFLQYPSEESEKYDLIIYSPVIGSGVSIVNENLTFAMLLNTQVVPSNEAWQMVARNRRATEIYISFDRASNFDLVTDAEIFIEAQKERLAELHIAESANHGIEVESVAEITQKMRVTELTMLQAQITATRNADLNDYSNAFIGLGLLQGRAFEYSIKKKQTKIHGLKDATLAEIAENRFNANVIDDATAEEYSNSGEPTQEQSNELNRHNACKMAGVADITLDDVRNHLDGATNKVVKVEMLLKPDVDLRADDVANSKTLNKQGSKVKEKQIFNKVLSVLTDKSIAEIIEASEQNGFDDVDIITISPEIAVSICKILQKHHKALSHKVNYAKLPKSHAIYRVNSYLKKYGIRTPERATYQKITDKKERIYRIFFEGDIARYTTNRVAFTGTHL